LGLPHGSIRHYGLNGDVNSVLLIADIVLYGSAQDVQGFPPLLIRAMTFEIPVIAPDFPVLRKYVSLFLFFFLSFTDFCNHSYDFIFIELFSTQIVDGVHGVFYSKHNPEALMNAFSLLLSSGRLSKFAQAIGSSGRQFAKNVLALDCITGYARLLENVLNFPSDSLLPGPVSQIQQGAWGWSFFQNEIELDIDVLKMDDDFSNGKVTAVHAVEQEFGSLNYSTNILENVTKVPIQDEPTKLDWDILNEIETSEESEMLEMEQVRCNLAIAAIGFNFYLPLYPFHYYLYLFHDQFIIENLVLKIISFCCRLMRGWTKMLVFGMRYIAVLGNLRN
jgi:hypothetical protein